MSDTTPKTAAPSQTFTVSKPFPDATTGISFAGSGSSACPVLVVKVNHSTGLFADNEGNDEGAAPSLLVPGLKVEKINDHSIATEHLSAEQVAAMVQEANAGPLTIQVSGVVAKATKPDGSPTQSVGITLEKVPVVEDDDQVVIVMLIKNIQEDSLLRDSGLQVGQHVTYINGQKCPTRTADIVNLFQSSIDVTVVAIDTDVTLPETPPYVMHVKAMKPHPSTMVGIKLRKVIVPSLPSEQTDDDDNNGNNKSRQFGIMVTTVEKDGIFANTALEPGHLVMKINGKQCPRSSTQTAELIAAISTLVELQIDTRHAGMVPPPPATTSDGNDDDIPSSEQANEETKQEKEKATGTSHENDTNGTLVIDSTESGKWIGKLTTQKAAI